MENTELKMLKDKCLLFYEFMIDKGFIPKELISAYLETKKLIENAYKEGKIKSLKAASHDIDDQVIRHMPLPIALELKKLFLEQLNIDFEIVDKLRLKTIQNIINKGKISTNYEYELLCNRIDEIYANNSKAYEVKQINELLTAFDKNAQ